MLNKFLHIKFGQFFQFLWLDFNNNNKQFITYTYKWGKSPALTAILKTVCTDLVIFMMHTNSQMHPNRNDFRLNPNCKHVLILIDFKTCTFILNL